MPSKNTTSSTASNDGTTKTSEAADLQKELLEAYEEASRAWLARVQSEIALWSQLSTKLASTRSVPEALQAFTEATSQRMKMTAEDGQRLMDDYQRIIQKLITSWPTRWPK